MKRKISKSILLSIVLIVTGCSVSDNISSLESISNEAKEISTNKTFLTKSEIDNFKKEYGKFSIKALTQQYLERKIRTFVINDNTGEKLEKEIEYARIVHPQLLIDIFQADNNLYNTVKNKARVDTRINNDPIFSSYLQQVSNVSISTNATDLTGISFTANWNTVENSTSYTLYVSDGTNTNSYNINDPNLNSYNVGGLKFGTNYSYYVTANNSNGVISSSNTENITTKNDAITFSSTRDGSNEIYVMNSDGSSTIRFTNNSFEDIHPSFSPDGSKITFISDRDGNNEIYVMNSDGSNLTRLTNNSSYEYSPSFSSDGSKITFASDRDGYIQIYLMNSDGSNQTSLTSSASHNNSYPNFSPDGSKITFMSEDGYSAIYVMNSDGSNQINLTSNSNFSFNAIPNFSPDGNKIIFASDRDGNSEIYLMNIDGSNQTRLTNNFSYDSNPSFSSDGSKIIFASDRDGTYQLYVMDSDGSNQTRLTNNSSYDNYPSWGYKK